MLVMYYIMYLPKYCSASLRYFADEMPCPPTQVLLMTLAESTSGLVETGWSCEIGDVIKYDKNDD